MGDMSKIMGGPVSTVPSAAGGIAAIANWCEALQGKGPLINALHSIKDAVLADMAILTRYSRVSGDAYRGLIADSAPHAHRTPSVQGGFGQDMLGAYATMAKPGSVWLHSMLDEGDNDALHAFHRARGLVETAVIPLGMDEKHYVLFELHFAHAIGPAEVGLINMFAATMAQTWKNRTPGVLTESMLNRARRPQPAIAAPILSYENPCRLSRAEYRVCLMLSRGLSKPQIQSELAITNSTMRTHLRNIYAKTGTTGQSDLIYALMSAEPATHLGLAGAVA